MTASDTFRNELLVLADALSEEFALVADAAMNPNFDDATVVGYLTHFRKLWKMHIESDFADDCVIDVEVNKDERTDDCEKPISIDQFWVETGQHVKGIRDKLAAEKKEFEAWKDGQS